MSRYAERPVSPYAAVLAALGNSVFSPLSTDTLARFAIAGSPISLEPGSVLFQTGEVGDAAYVVLEGEVEIVIRTLGGRDLRLNTLGAGSVVGEMASLDGGERSAEVVATRRTRLWRLPRASLINALTSEPAAAVGLIAELSRRLRAANAALESSRLLDLGGRLAQMLLTEMGPRRVVSLTQTEMARRLGASREKVNRKLNVWSTQGWVELSRNGVKVIADEQLADLFRHSTVMRRSQ